MPDRRDAGHVGAPMTDSIGERVAAEKAIDLGAARARRRTKPAAKKSPMAQMNGHVDHADHEECQG